MSSIILDENQAIFWDGSRATIFTIDFNLSKTEKKVKLFFGWEPCNHFYREISIVIFTSNNFLGNDDI
jgi:hypothetical protein